jgi:hypothetical protein
MLPRFTGIHLEVVCRVLGKLVLDDETAARAEWQPFDVVVLGLVGCDAIHRLSRLRHLAERAAADLAGRAQIGLEQRRREPQRPGLVVEAAAHVVRGKEGRRVDVEREQIADGVAILRAIQAVQSWRRQPLDCAVIELALEPARDLHICLARRAGIAGRRHHPGAQLADYVLPLLGIRRDAVELRVLEREAAGLLGVAMAVEAVVVDRRLVLRDHGLARRLTAGGHDARRPKQ